MNLKSWLQLGRAQTYPGDWLLVLVPFISNSSVNLTQVLILSAFMWFVHLASFGENSLHDFLGGWDKIDSAKSHHPLPRGDISTHDAISVVHWGKNALMFVGCLMCFLWSPNPTMSMFCLFMWYSWGTGYNLGLSKVSLFGFIPISICFMFMGGFGWFLSHRTLTKLGWWYLSYVLLTILFQISYSGHLKEMGQAERSNILIKMGASLRGNWFNPSWSLLYAYAVKVASIYPLAQIMMFKLNALSLVWFCFTTIGVAFMVAMLTVPRTYDRARELKWMSLMEIVSIYAVIPLMIPWVWAIPLMASGVIYFYVVNKALWGVSYPKV